MYFHAHDVNSISWSSCCRPIQACLATNLSQKKRLFEDVWRCKGSTSCRAPFGWILAVSDCIHQCISSHCFVSHSPSKKVSQAVVAERSAGFCMWKKCRSFGHQYKKLAKSRKLYPLLSFHKNVPIQNGVSETKGWVWYLAKLVMQYVAICNISEVIASCGVVQSHICCGRSAWAGSLQ